MPNIRSMKANAKDGIEIIASNGATFSVSPANIVALVTQAGGIKAVAVSAAKTTIQTTLGQAQIKASQIVLDWNGQGKVTSLEINEVDQ